MRRRIGIYGATEESLRLVGLLVANPDLDIVSIYDADSSEALVRASQLGPELEDFVRLVVTDDLDSLLGRSELHALIDAGPTGELHRKIPNAVERGLQIVTPLAARLLWAYGVAARDRKAELLQALQEVVESVQLTVDSDELFTRMLEIAIGVTGADGGSVMLLDPEAGELRIRVAVGVERELWPKIRVPLGEGIAGRVAADARPLRVAGKADHHSFRVVRERLDVESALCVPLIDRGVVLGVLNLHHSTRRGTFTEEDLGFVEQLAELDAQIISRAQQHEELSNHAARYEAVRDLHQVLDGPDPLPERLRALCVQVAKRVAGGIANLYLREGDERELRLVATSLEGGGFGGEYRIVMGQGIDGRVAESQSPRFLRDDLGHLEYASLPLRSAGQLVGVLSVQAGTDAPGDERAQDALLELAGALADELAQAAREGRMATRATRLSSLHEIGMQMLSARSLTEVIRLATSSASTILEAEHAVLRLQDDVNRRFVIRSYFGPADGPAQEQLFQLDRRASLRALQRQQAIRVHEVSADADLGGAEAGCQSLMAAPLRSDGAAIGTLAVYDKIAPDRFVSSHFDDDDLQVFAKLSSYVAQAVIAAQERGVTKQQRNIDVETGLPNASTLRQRLEEEISRAAGRPGQLSLASCLIENFDELEREVGAAHARRVVQRVGDSLRRELRDFDVVGRSARDRFGILLPAPGPTTGDRVYELARAVADAISKDETLNRPLRVALGFGYALHPDEGDDATLLEAAAATPRIRMV